MLTTSETGLVLSNQLWFVSYPDGAARRITNDLHAYYGASVTRDAATIVSVQGESAFDLWTVRLADPSRPTRVTSAMRRDTTLGGIAWTPDGKIVHSSIGPDGLDLWIRDPDGGNSRQLTQGSGLNAAPSVSPDGKRIYFASNRSGAFHIWRIDLNGGNLTQVTDGDGEWQPVVSRDGRWLVYVSRETGYYYEARRVPLDGGQSERITRDLTLQSPVLSPDGTRMLFGYGIFTGDSTFEKTGVVSFAPEGTRTHAFDITTFGGCRNVCWSPDGGSLIFVETSEGVSNLWRQPLDGGAPEPLTRFAEGSIRNIDLSPDGKTHLFDRGRIVRDVVMIRRSD